MRLGRLGPRGDAVVISADAARFAYVRDCLGGEEGGRETTVRDLLRDADALARVRDGLDRAAWHPLSQDALRVPLPGSRVLAVGLNYRSHAEEVGRAPPDAPTVFAKLASALADPFGEIAARAVSETLDYEAELAVIVGRPLDDAGPEEAEAAVCGYAVANDLTLRAYARPETLTLAKGLAASCPLGPWITTADEVGGAPGGWRALRVRSSVNGEVRQDASCAEMIHAPAEVLSYVSRFTPLVPSDVLLTGSPAGSGASFDPPRWLAPGDVVCCEVEGVGAALGAVETTITPASPPRRS